MVIDSRFSLQRFRINSELVFFPAVDKHPPCFTLDVLSFIPFGCSTIRCTKMKK